MVNRIYESSKTIYKKKKSSKKYKLITKSQGSIKYNKAKIRKKFIYSKADLKEDFQRICKPPIPLIWVVVIIFNKEKLFFIYFYEGTKFMQFAFKQK